MNSYRKFKLHTQQSYQSILLHTFSLFPCLLLSGRKNSGRSGDTEKTYQSVPSTSNTIPFSRGALWGFPFTGSKGANCLAGPRVASVVDMLSIKILEMIAKLCWIQKGRNLGVTVSGGLMDFYFWIEFWEIKNDSVTSVFQATNTKIHQVNLSQAVRHRFNTMV